MRLALLRRSLTMEEVFEVSVVDEDDHHHYEEEENGDQDKERVALPTGTAIMMNPLKGHSVREPAQTDQGQSAKMSPMKKRRKTMAAMAGETCCCHCGSTRKRDFEQDENEVAGGEAEDFEEIVDSDAVCESVEEEQGEHEAEHETVQNVASTVEEDVPASTHAELDNPEAEQASLPNCEDGEDVSSTSNHHESVGMTMLNQATSQQHQHEDNDDVDDDQASETPVQIVPKWQIREETPILATSSASERAKALKRGYDGTVDPWCSKNKIVTLQTKDGPKDVHIVQHKAQKCDDGSDRYRCPVPNCSYGNLVGSRVFISKHFTRVHTDYRSWRDVFLNKDAPMFVVRDGNGGEATAKEPDIATTTIASTEPLQPLWTQANKPPICATTMLTTPVASSAEQMMTSINNQTIPNNRVPVSSTPPVPFAPISFVPHQPAQPMSTVKYKLVPVMIPARMASEALTLALQQSQPEFHLVPVQQQQQQQQQQQPQPQMVQTMQAQPQPQPVIIAQPHQYNPQFVQVQAIPHQPNQHQQQGAIVSMMPSASHHQPTMSFASHQMDSGGHNLPRHLPANQAGFVIYNVPTMQ